MRNTAFKAISLLLCLFCCLLPGCKAKPSEAPEAPPAKVVTDGLGRQVQIEGEVKRIASFYPIATHYLFILGEQDKLICSDGGGEPGALLQSFSPSSGEAAQGGRGKGATNVEALLELKPDLVLVKGHDQKGVEELASRGLTVYAVKAEQPGEVMATMESLGKILGKEDRAEKKDITSKTEKLPESSRPKVYFAGTDILKVAGGDMYQSRLVEMAGGRPLGKDLKGGWVTVSAEQILKWDPKVILIPRYGWKDVKGPETVKEDPRFKDIKAVKENKVWWFPLGTHALGLAHTPVPPGLDLAGQNTAP